MLDNSRFVWAVIGARQLGFDARVIVEKLSNLAMLETYEHSRRKLNFWTKSAAIWNKNAVIWNKKNLFIVIEFPYITVWKGWGWALKNSSCCSILQITFLRSEREIFLRCTRRV